MGDGILAQALQVETFQDVELHGDSVHATLRHDGPRRPGQFRRWLTCRSGLAIAMPVDDLLEIGAGGGSLARVNSLGLLQVGPDSAGSSPGPVCYGLGGSEPTVTDADLVLGYLNPNFFLGGMLLDGAAAAEAIGRHIAGPMKRSPVEAAWGIYDLVNETMAAAARVYVAEKWQNARSLSLVAFGGAGPAHAAGLARKLGCPRVIVPPRPGAMSSLGLLVAPMAFERSRSLRLLLAEANFQDLDRIARDMEGEASAAPSSGNSHKRSSRGRRRVSGRRSPPCRTGSTGTR